MKHRLLTVTALITITWFTPPGEIKPAAANHNYRDNVNQLAAISPSSSQNNIAQQLPLMLVIVGSGVLVWLAVINSKAVFGKLFFQKTNLNQTISAERPISMDANLKEEPLLTTEKTDIALTTEKTDIATYIKQAYSHFKQGDSQKAIEEFNKAIGINPQDAYLYGERANFRRKNLGDKEGAIDDYSKAIGIHPQNALFYLWRSQTYNDLGEQIKAIEDYNTALRLAPENTMYHSFQRTSNSRE
ncbi:tetratricopeptide repeat protein [Fortiea sp. LEGE XX443]|uniref:tetratricopeptide repeat protein n=1 Tax=Fortiea sp. LEGE XX443 TaxID=1828611 RepID=UPI00187E0795|nr:tetratricopeptide repeat protein [Fortiea sp. LEGE XX443]MBE9007043.1 tetratricopeptide repeat protein [Fortiea sp. LEGE XX443]